MPEVIADRGEHSSEQVIGFVDGVDPDEAIRYGAVGTDHDIARPRPGDSEYRV